MAEKKIKGPKKLERHFKGVANHRRVQILQLIAKTPNLSLIEIADRIHGNFKTVAEHTRRLVIAGLVEKSAAGREVQHRLTPYGKIFIDFIETFSRS